MNYYYTWVEWLIPPITGSDNLHYFSCYISLGLSRDILPRSSEKNDNAIHHL
jgi:hypothetical protein